MTLINHTFRAAMGMAIAGVFGGAALAQQSITSFTGISYQQNFDTLANTGTGLSTPLPANWLLSENASAGSPTTAGTYTAGTGSVATVDLYSYGSSGSTERALGSTYANANAAFGIIFRNNTGRTITSLYIGYRGEQWRQGDTGATLDRLDFTYNSNTSSLFGTGWLDFNGLDFTTPNTTSGANAAIDGNASGNFTLKAGLITGLSIPNGQSFGIRWRDSNGSGTDDGLAIDDLIVMVPEAWQPSAVAGLGLVGLVAWQRRRSVRNAAV